ncbi:MAG TPA: 2-oxo-tetronate isomerase [Vicinamibacterales bacterium]|nr:2-oxo-tetronate isomerase [Vicinamibacterales bacterium]
MRFAANLSMLFTELPFPERFAAAARAGFGAVEFLFPYEYAPEDLAQSLREHSLENVLFNLPPGDWPGGERGLTSLPGREAEFRQSVDRALEYARALGTPRLHAMAGIVPSSADRAVHREVYVANLRYAARALAREGRTLLIEAINPRDIPGYFLNSQADAHAIREEVGEPNLKVQMDFYHAQIVDGDLAMTFRQYAPHIGHVQIAGVPDRDEPDHGEVNYHYLLPLLDELGYAGWVGCEYRPRGRTVDGLGWIEGFK